jgi:hypothetical protein
VSPGVYVESINFLGKDITVRSVYGPLTATITNERTHTLAIFGLGETNAAVLEGFTLQGGWMAVLISNSAPTIKHNICRDQNVWNWAAIGIAGDVIPVAEPSGDPRFSPKLGEAPAVIVNNTIVNCANGAISEFSTTAPTIKNNLIVYNYSYGIHVQNGESQEPPVLGYNNLWGGHDAWFINVNDIGPGFLHSDPLFGDDYTLLPGSPCIDAGDPNPLFNDPDGTRNDIGAVSTSNPSTCCVGRVGDANLSGDDEPTVGDIGLLIDAKFISGNCTGVLQCLTEADINQSGGRNPTCDDVSIADIATLIDYLFITGTSLGLADCL